ncbi:MAG: hypothetical protein AMXMBFR37_22750 [Steroidobacteraceae bacterium]
MSPTPEFLAPAPPRAAVPPDRTYTSWARHAIAEMATRDGESFSLFESSVPEPEELLAATIAAAFAPGIPTRYTSAFLSGNPYVVRELQKHYGVDAASILCTTGASGAMSLVYRALLRPGDRILVENPAFDLFAELAGAQGIAVDRFERRDGDFALDPAAVAAAMRPRTRLIVCTNLHNPSGALAGADVLREVGTIARARDALVVVDEVYGDYAGDALVPAATLGAEFLSISSLTKNYGLSTLRCGWAVGHPGVIARVREVSDELEFGVSKLGHAVAAHVLEEPARWQRYWQDMLDAARPIMQHYHSGWARAGLIEGALPRHGCITFPRLVGIDDTKAFSDTLAREQAVYVAPGEYFGRAGHVRIGFAQPAARLRQALERLDHALRQRS